MNSGFTLLEVLIAFAILAVSLTAVFASLSGSLSAERTSRSYTGLVMEARSVMDLVGVEIPLQNGVRQGQTASGVSWVLDAKEMDPLPRDSQNLSNLKAFQLTLNLIGLDARSLTVRRLKLAETQ